MDRSSTEQQHQVSSDNVVVRRVVSERLLRVYLFCPAGFCMVVCPQWLSQTFMTLPLPDGSNLSDLALGLAILALSGFCCLSL